MNPTVVGTVVLACTLAGTLVGIWLQTILPKQHFDDESKETVNNGIRLIATMTALLVGLITASAKSSFDDMDTAVESAATNVLILDRLLARYGPETGEIRERLQQVFARRVNMIWSQSSSRPDALDPSASASRAEVLTEGIRRLTPRDDSQRALQSRALHQAETLLGTRWLTVTGSTTSIPLPFLVVLIFWLTITFASFGLFAPRNGMVLSVLFLCALSVGSAVFLVLELDGPFDGLIRVSADPLLYAIEHLNQ